MGVNARCEFSTMSHSPLRCSHFKTSRLFDWASGRRECFDDEPEVVKVVSLGRRTSLSTCRATCSDVFDASFGFFLATEGEKQDVMKRLQIIR